MIGFKQNKKEEVLEEKQEYATKEKNVDKAVRLHANLSTQNLAYTVKDSFPYASWVRENIEDSEVDPIVILESHYNPDFLTTVIAAGNQKISDDLPADYIQDDADGKAVQTSNKIEVNIL